YITFQLVSFPRSSLPVVILLQLILVIIFAFLLFRMLSAFVILSYAVTYTGAAQFLQLSDFHFDRDYSAQFGNVAEKCHQKSNVKRSKLGQFGDYACDAPKSLIKKTLAAAKEVIPNPDFVFWTGDNVPHIDDYNETYVELVLQTVSGMLYTAYPNTSVLPIFGNHDYAPSNAFPDHNCSLYSNIYKMWKNWIGSANMDTFLKGGYYKYAAPNNVTILALNTNLYYKFNQAIPNFTNPSDPADQFQFITDTLDVARRQRQTVHVVAHIPPGVFERTPNFTWMLPQYNQRFIDITVRYADTIKWMIFGHHHTDTFHIVKDPGTGNPVQVYLIAPAVTPWFSSLEGAGANNPAFRVFDYDVRTQQLLDAKTYYIDLNLLNKNASAKWQLEYSMSQTYGISKIITFSLSVHQKMNSGVPRLIQGNFGYLLGNFNAFLILFGEAP
uniref:Calcineurin-like phosphoesterase domain-containing protein n=1 Tax=Parascaris univalens TaxID=6257 RepID=A0A915CJW6_PARUN